MNSFNSYQLHMNLAGTKGGVIRNVTDMAYLNS